MAGTPLLGVRHPIPTAAKPAFHPNYFQFCKSAFFASTPIFPFIYKGFIEVQHPIFAQKMLPTVRSVLFPTHAIMRPMNAEPLITGHNKEDNSRRDAEGAERMVNFNPLPFSAHSAPLRAKFFAPFAVLYRRIVQFQQDYCRKGTQRTQRQGLMQFILCDFCVLLWQIPVWLRLRRAACFAVQEIALAGIWDLWLRLAKLRPRAFALKCLYQSNLVKPFPLP